jgi:hypothetical protein
LLVDVAVIVTEPPAAGAVNVVVAPLAVCVALKDPQFPAGVQDQSTPPFALSFVTVAAIVAVPLAAIVKGGAVLRAIAMPGGVVPDDDDETAPQPEKLTASNKTLAIAKHAHFDDTRSFSTLVSLLI